MTLHGSRYDPELQMFRDPPREPDPARLRFLRWLSEIRRLEHEPVGAPAGQYAAAVLRHRPEPGDDRAPFLNARR
jgi:hypothetical protein